MKYVNFRHAARFACSFGLLMAVISFLSAQSFELEDVMSYAFPSDLTVAPEGDAVAWVFNQEGRRNIWIAQGPEYLAQKLTAYEQDDGQEISSLTFNAEGNIIVYVRGGDANRAGEYPNPTSSPEGALQAVWAVKIEGGKPWHIGVGENPQTSPVDNSLLFNSKGKIFLVSLEGKPIPEQLFQARGENSRAVWSPDASKIAFVSLREDHSFIGIYDLNKKSIGWISPSVDRDSYPVWSPSGEYVAFIRFPGLSGGSFRRRSKFSLMVGDVASKQAVKIWESPNDTGGFSQYYPAQTLRWAADGYLVFYSEHERWMHLYAISVKDKKIIPLSPGVYEVENSFLTADRKTLVFNSNSGDIDRRHLWTVPVKGGGAKQLTSGEGLEWAPKLTSKSQDLVFLCSTAFQPASPAFIKHGEKEKRLFVQDGIPARFPAKELVQPEQVVFDAPDSLRIHGQLFVPKQAKAGDGRPAVIFMHGGPIRQMMLGWHMRGYYHHAYALNQYLANKGYLVLSVNYRSGIGYGYDFRTAPKQGPRGASEYQDIVAAGKYLQNRPEVDPNKIGLWGGSYGGYLTAMGLARDSELFAAGVDLHGVHDWALRSRRRNGGGWEISGEDLMSSAYQSSPVADIDFWTSPVLFIHGDDDRNVDFVQTTDLVQRLRKLGKTHIELLIFPDEVHGFLRHDVWLEVYSTAAVFFDRFLLKKHR